MNLRNNTLVQWFFPLVLLLSCSLNAQAPMQTKTTYEYCRKKFGKELHKVVEQTSPLMKKYLPAHWKNIPLQYPKAEKSP
jgi:hypothetical protein